MNILKWLKRQKRPFPRALDDPRKSERLEIVLSGLGGQGMILAGKILAEAAAIYDQKEAVMSQSYGPEARGGASRAEIIISTNKIDYPKVAHTDALLVMTQEALDKYGKLLDAESLLIADETFIKTIPTHLKNIFKAPFGALAIRLFNAPVVANIIALGSLAAITHIVSREALIHAVLSRVPDKVLVLDRMAVDAGFKAVEDSGFQLAPRFDDTKDNK